MSPYRAILGLPILLALFLLIAACNGHEKHENHADLNKIPMQTVCMGRMFVEMPQGKLNWIQHFDFAKVKRLPATIDTSHKFWSAVVKKKDKLLSQDQRMDNSMLSGYKKINAYAAMLLHRDSKYDISGYNLDRYLWLGDWGYHFESKALLANNERNKFTQFDEFVGQLTPISNTAPPEKSGFCIDSALVKGKIGPIWANAATEVKRWKGVRVSVGTSEDDGSREPLSWQKDKKVLSPRTPFEDLNSRKSHVPDNQASFTVIRQQNKELSGMKGEETAFKVTLDNGQKYYKFVWRTIDKESSENKTGFGFQLSAGDYYYTTNYHEPPDQEELLALWDTMLVSLKNRPDAR